MIISKKKFQKLIDEKVHEILCKVEEKRRVAEERDRLERYIGSTDARVDELAAEIEKMKKTRCYEHETTRYTSEQVAEMIGISVDAVLRYRKLGIIDGVKLPNHKRGRNPYYFDRANIEKLQQHFNTPKFNTDLKYQIMLHNGDYTTQALAELLGVNKSTVKKWARGGHLTGYKVSIPTGSAWRFPKESVCRFVEVTNKT